jgi:hypothetical protein
MPGADRKGLCFGAPATRRTAARRGFHDLNASAGSGGRGARARVGVEVDQCLLVGLDCGQASSPTGQTDLLPERGSKKG